MDRTLQCVASLGVARMVASTMAVSFSPVIHFGRPLRGASRKILASPSLSNRFPQRSTVGTDVDNLRAKAWFAIPSAAPSTICNRSAMLGGVPPLRHSANICLRSDGLTASLGAAGRGIKQS